MKKGREKADSAAAGHKKENSGDMMRKTAESGVGGIEVLYNIYYFDGWRVKKKRKCHRKWGMLSIKTRKLECIHG